MLSLSPAKLLVILVIALIVLGPDKLPQVARQIGAAWHDLRGWRSRIESEVRGTFPNLPPTHEVAQAVRSPLAFLDRLADDHERALSEQATEATVSEGAGPDGDAGVGPGPPGDGTVSPNGTGDPHDVAATNGVASSNGAASPNGAASSSPGVHNGSVGANGAGVGSGAGAPVVPSGFPAVPDDPSMN